MWILNWYREGGGGATITKVIYKDRRLVVSVQELDRPKVILNSIRQPVIKTTRIEQPKINILDSGMLTVNLEKVKLIKVITLCQQ
jgi:hypothetical protein